MSHWAESPLDRNQVVLFCPTLDDQIPPDHPVRLFDEVLRAVDRSAWESMYVKVAGQPPIHPRVVASAILYGLSLGIRSSRVLESPAEQDPGQGFLRVRRGDCSNRPLASRCLPKNATQRRVCRDEYEPLRKQMARRMNSARGKADYRRGSHAAETPFGFFKSVMLLRKYLLVGLAKVSIEQRWADTAYNLLKLVRFIARQAAGEPTPTGPAIAAGP